VPCHRSGFWLVAAGICGGLLGAAPAQAETSLSVDLSATLGPATHVASGSLYGVTETSPADVNALIAPLHPNMFTNPAANVQQPVGDAIVVAGRLAPTGARVTVRLADWFKGFYTFTSMADWFDKIAQTVNRRKAAGITNIYAYEIWNEPAGTYASSNPLSFNEFWRQTFSKLRELDPEIKITGPSLSYYNESWLKGFLSFCKTNACLPDIVGWHELGGGDVEGNLRAYRALEKQLGIGPLPISINEYSGAGRIDVEGQPGASAPLIAKFERFRVDTACISYWDVAHAGRLGSLLASNTEPNGGWWFYKWYGEMSGSMVATTPPNPASATALDGFANLDTTGRWASVVFGGTNDGTIKVVVKGFGAAAPFFGNEVQVVVERAPFVNRTTVVKATDRLTTAELPITNDQISVSVSGANASAGYRLRLTPMGNAGASAGTSAGAGSSSSSAGSTSRGVGGTSGTLMASGGVAIASGGARPSGGSAGSGGSAHAMTSAGVTAMGGTTTTRVVNPVGAAGARVSDGGKEAAGGYSGSISKTGDSSAPPSGGRDASHLVTHQSGGSVSLNVSGAANAGADANATASGCDCSVPVRQRATWAPAIVLFLLIGSIRAPARRRRAGGQRQ
jgi:hypothetical protein